MVQTKLFSDLYLVKFLNQQNCFFHVGEVDLKVGAISATSPYIRRLLNIYIYIYIYIYKLFLINKVKYQQFNVMALLRVVR